jgi:hypothetical protein
MDVMRRGVAPLRIVLVVIFAVLVVLQVVSFPGKWAHMAREEPDLSYLRWPLTAFTAVVILCAQVVIVCTWKLLSLVRRDRVFTRDAERWVDGIIGAVTVAWLLLAGLFLYVGSTADDPGGVIALLLVLLVVTALWLLMPVMRGLLRQATRLRTELDALR